MWGAAAYSQKGKKDLGNVQPLDYSFPNLMPAKKNSNLNAAAKKLEKSARVNIKRLLATFEQNLKFFWY